MLRNLSCHLPVPQTHATLFFSFVLLLPQFVFACAAPERWQHKMFNVPAKNKPQITHNRHTHIEHSHSHCKLRLLDQQASLLSRLALSSTSFAISLFHTFGWGSIPTATATRLRLGLCFQVENYFRSFMMRKLYENHGEFASYKAMRWGLQYAAVFYMCVCVCVCTQCCQL